MAVQLAKRPLSRSPSGFEAGTFVEGCRDQGGTVVVEKTAWLRI